MIRILIAGGVLVLSAPLAAQQATPPASAEPAPAPAPAADAAPVADAGAPDGDFASYDADKSGQLDKKEFSTWFAAKHQGHDGADGKSSATVAFRKADIDKSQTVSAQELGQFLAG